MTKHVLKFIICSLLIGSLLIPFASCGSGDPTQSSDTGTDSVAATADSSLPDDAPLADRIEALAANLTDNASVTALRELIWQEYAEQVAEESPERATEIQKNKITNIKIGRTTMKVQTKVVGKQPADGYPVFLVYHGGGYDPSGTTNESQWAGMADRYTQTRVSAIYISIRSVSDNESSGQIFSTDISWAFYDRIIEDCILYMNADPNKVYIVGYSAGGNGVYQIAPVLADRLASATMTAGHPEGIDLTNLYNLPFYLNVGELDSAYSRNTVTVEYSEKLDALAEKYGGGYFHQCFVHVGKEHGVVGDNATTDQTVVKDLAAWYAAYTANGTLASATGNTTKANTDAATLMTAHTRDPLPTRVIWNTTVSKADQRGIESFYWISSTAAGSTIDVSYDKATNTITMNTSRLRSGEITLYLNEDMVDLFSPVKVVLTSGTVLEYTPEISLELLRSTTAERGDPNYQFAASITLTSSDLKK
ncbi:MAG: hypothetical protein ACI3YK_07195 [Eubacteriales bacterium]